MFIMKLTLTNPINDNVYKDDTFKQVSAIARDAIKFVRAFGGAIMASTPHLYVSALPFSPVQSIIYKQFSSKYSNLAQIVDGGESCWPNLQRIIRGYDDGVISVAFSPDGKRIASGSWDKTICVWDAETGLQLGSPFTLGHTDSVWSVAFAPDGKRIASGSQDKTICLWDAETGLQLGSPLTGCTGPVLSVAFSPDGKRIASGSFDKTICLWDAETGLQLGSPLTRHTGLVYSVAFSPDGKRIASGSLDKTICLWDAETGLQLGSPLTGHTDSVHSVAFSPDGKRIASGSHDKTICLWDAETGLQLGSPLTGHTDSVQSVAFSPDGKRIASGSWDKTICLWDTETGLQLGNPLTGHTDPVYSVVFSPDGQRVVSGTADNTIHMWDGPTDAVVNLHSDNIPRHPSHSLCYSSNPSHTLLDSNVYIPGSDFNVRTLLELDSGGWIVSPKGHLLLWIPSYMPRPSLYSPNRLFVIGKHINLDLSRMVHGSRWIECNYMGNIAR